jgi:hypothetical protein
MSVSCNLCQSFSIGSFSCSSKKNAERDSDEEFSPDDVEFELIDSDQKKFEDLIPANENYLYMKILHNGKIISVSGSSLKEIPLEENDILEKNIDDIDIYKNLFLDYIKPLYEHALKKGEAYQFFFKTNMSETLIACSIYPCSIPKHITSVDVVIRYAHKSISETRISKFAFRNNSPNGEKVELLE